MSWSSKTRLLGCSTLELLKLQQCLDNRKISKKFLTQDINPTTDSGKLTVTIFAVFSEHESTINGARTKGDIAVLKSNGVRLGSPQLTNVNIIAARRIY